MRQPDRTMSRRDIPAMFLRPMFLRPMFLRPLFLRAMEVRLGA